jgi:hypothetical protein
MAKAPGLDNSFRLNYFKINLLNCDQSVVLPTFVSFANDLFATMGVAPSATESVSVTALLIACALGLVHLRKRSCFGAAYTSKTEYSRCSRAQAHLNS